MRAFLIIFERRNDILESRPKETSLLDRERYFNGQLTPVIEKEIFDQTVEFN